MGIKPLTLAELAACNQPIAFKLQYESASGISTVLGATAVNQSVYEKRYTGCHFPATESLLLWSCSAK